MLPWATVSALAALLLAVLSWLLPVRTPATDGELFKRLKSMTMIRKPLGIGTLALFSANPKETLGAIAVQTAQQVPGTQWDTV
ncbi:hypothetical protein D3C78_1786560 [compost metagenome]